MSLYSTLCSGLVFPLHERIKGHDSVARRQRLEESQWWDEEKFRVSQLARLRGFLSDIGENFDRITNQACAGDVDSRRVERAVPD